MVLGPKLLLKLVKTQKLVEGLSERELTNPEGAGFDLRLGEVYRIKGEAFLGETHRKTAEVELVASYNSKNQLPAGVHDRDRQRKANAIVIKPGDFFLVKTIESVNMPQNLTASITPRSTTYRSGLFVRTGNVPPGYCGGLTFGLKNEGPVTVEIEMGARFVHIQFSEVAGGGNMYRGQWQGGRVTARKKERQV
ncbi:MAG: 2'-deoxycytidine 5'-triphosphate deaminase [Candidatus Levybacteria bacterium]|nr:2'-deoxycytidine 5'-triphosphate deaminase [Candidatus Levybacteria bacterium]